MDWKRILNWPYHQNESAPKSGFVDSGYLQSRGFSPDEAKQILKETLSLKKGDAPFPAMHEGQIGIQPEDYVKQGFFKEQNLKQFTKGAFNVHNALISLFTQAVNDRHSYIAMSMELRGFYIVQAILNLLAQDVLNSDEAGNIIEITAKKPEIQKEIDELTKKYDFDVLLQEITRDFIDIGEYTLRLKVVKGEGIVGIYDDVDPLNVLTFYDGGIPVNYLTYKDREYKVLPAFMFAHFCVGNNKLRIRMQDQLSLWQHTNQNEIPEKLRDELPDYIRVGEPLFYGIVPKLRELQLLEQLVPATKLNQITQTQFVSMKVPAGMAPEKVMDALKRYEAMLNIPTGINVTQDQITLAEIMTVTGKIRVVPNFSDQKGAIEPINPRANAPVDDLLAASSDIRAIILSSIGIPPSLLFGTAGPEKSTEIRLFSRYTRRLSDLQQALAKGLRQIILIHLVNKGLTVTAEDFEIFFKESLVDLSGLEKLEFDDAKQQIVGQSIDFVNKIFAQPLLAEMVDHEELMKWIQTKFDILTSEHKLFKKNPKKLIDLAPPIAGGLPGAPAPPGAPGAPGTEPPPGGPKKEPGQAPEFADPKEPKTGPKQDKKKTDEI